MNAFDVKIQEAMGSYLRSYGVKTIQVNIGLRCNNYCSHCHLQASSQRTEAMDWPTMQQVLRVAHDVRPKLVDITGGAPEMNPLLPRFLGAIQEGGHSVQVRTNLTILLEPGMEAMMKFFAEREVKLVASLPCYLKKEVDAQRGNGTFERSIEALRRLNGLGYGMDPRLKLDLVFNPERAFLPPEQSSLEAEYREELRDNFGISFNGLMTITNMPIGRFLQLLRREGMDRKYEELLRKSFNPLTIERLMCLNQVDVAWDGGIYDCDFNLALGVPVNYGAPQHIRDFDAAKLSRRRIVTGDHCFGCTAGHGSSCEGALLQE
jgi:radical SAM/Cys-rich protein